MTAGLLLGSIMRKTIAVLYLLVLHVLVHTMQFTHEHVAGAVRLVKCAQSFSMTGAIEHCLLSRNTERWRAAYTNFMVQSKFILYHTMDRGPCMRRRDAGKTSHDDVLPGQVLLICRTYGVLTAASMRTKCPLPLASRFGGCDGNESLTPLH